MNLRIWFLLWTLFPCCIAYAQGGWIKQVWTNPDLVFYDVTFVDASTGFIVGDQGTILRTRDGGATWSALSSGTQEILHAVHFLDPGFGAVVGAKGTLKVTTDLGTTWIDHSITTNASLYDVRFLTRDTGFITGGSNTVLRSVDGGNQWTDCKAGFGISSARAISFPSHRIGFIVGHDGKIARTKNGGATWTQLNSRVDNNFFAVSFADTLTGTAIGRNGAFSQTWDGGKTWYPDSILSLSSYQLTGIQYITPTRGYFVTWNGMIFRSDDAGRTWGVQESNSFDNLEAIHFSDPNHGVAVGWFGTILRTIDGGPVAVNDPSPLKKAMVIGDSYPQPYRGGKGPLFLPVTTMDAGELRITVLNALGQQIHEMSVLANEPGAITVPLVFPQSSSGIHVILVHHGTTVSAIRTLLMP